MKKTAFAAKAAAILSAAAMICGCTSAEKPEEDDVEYIAVYKEMTQTEAAAEDKAEEEVPEYADYRYLDHVMFVGDDICGAISENGLLDSSRVTADSDITSRSAAESMNTSEPYIYLWFGGRHVFDYDDEYDYADYILSAAIRIRDKYPESEVCILSVSPASRQKGGSDWIKKCNKAVKSEVKSCDDQYIRYIDTWNALADSDGYLPDVYDAGDGATINRAGCRKLLSYLEENRMYNPKIGDMKYRYLYKDMYVERPEYQVTEGKIAYLTFDDGPSKNTPYILDILDANDIKATFFITGWCIDGKEEILEDVAARGHAIGVHSYSHDYDEIYESVTAFLDDFNRGYNRIYDVTGQKPWAFRFPGGSYNNYNKSTADSIIAEMNRRGYTYYDWNAATSDATTSADYYSCMEYLEYSLYSNHSVVLMHDSLSLTVEYLQDAIDYIRGEGYSFETIDTADAVQF